MEAMTLFSVLMVRRAVESLGSSDTRTRAPLLTVRPANLQGNRQQMGQRHRTELRQTECSMERDDKMVTLDKPVNMT